MRRRLPSSPACGSSLSTRFRISAAALRVKVMARISSGRSTAESSFRNRRTRSSVFPEPAGAWTMNERAGSRARSRSPASAMMGSGDFRMAIQLYDLAGAEDDRRFSPYCWRVKMALKHKGLDFEAIPWRYTEKDRIEFTGSTTVPVIVDGSRAVYDSFEIAVYLDEAYPSRPGLFEGTESRALSFFLSHWAVGTLHPPLLRAIVMDVFNSLHEKDRAYFRETREKRVGGRLEDVGAEQKKWLAAFRGALEPLRPGLTQNAFISGKGP